MIDKIANVATGNKAPFRTTCRSTRSSSRRATVGCRALIDAQDAASFPTCTSTRSIRRSRGSSCSFCSDEARAATIALHPRRPVRSLARRRRSRSGRARDRERAARPDCGRRARAVSCTAIATFWSATRFAARDRLHAAPDGTLVDVFGEQVLLMHGDCSAPTTTATSACGASCAIPSAVVDHPAPGSRASGAAGAAPARRQPMHVGATAPEIMDVNAGAVIETMRRAGVSDAGARTHAPPGDPCAGRGLATPARRIVLGDWHAQGSVLEWRDDGVELRALAR